MLICSQAAIAQTTFSEPYQEKLLNGLKVLAWSKLNTDKLIVKIRIHRGSAFDRQGREGEIRLLADSIFPNETSRDYFREDLGGSLDIRTTYDYIEIDVTAKQDAMLSVLETLASAVANPAIDKETTGKLRDAQIARVKKLEADPAYVADRAAAKRLFGTFPYGRPELGMVESLQKTDFADLLDVKKRLLTADNSTLAISGNFDRSLAMRAIRRYFGPWLKSDKVIPATFRQPDPPDTKLLNIEMPNLDKSYSRFAVIVAARGDKDHFPMMVYVSILHGLRCPDAGKYQAYLLRGLYISASDGNILPYSGPCPGVGSTPLVNGLTPNEFDAAKTRVVSDFYEKVQTASGLAELWLDVDTFKLNSVSDETRKLNDVTLADVNALAERLRTSPVVRVSVMSPAPAKP